MEIEKTKKSKLPIIIAILAALCVLIVCGWLLVLKPLLTLKADAESIQRDDGSYQVVLNTQKGYADAEIFASLDLQRNGMLFAGSISPAGTETPLGFYFDADNKSVLMEIGPVIKTILPDDVRKIDTLLGATDNLNGKYISVDQVEQIAGVENLNDLAALAGISSTTSSDSTSTELVTAVKDIMAMVQSQDMSIRPLFSTEVLAQKGLETDGYYFFIVPQKTFDGTLYIGCGKTSNNGIIHLQAYLDYNDDSRLDEHVNLCFIPEVVSLHMPESVLTEDEVNTLSELFQLYKKLTGSNS